MVIILNNYFCPAYVINNSSLIDHSGPCESLWILHACPSSLLASYSLRECSLHLCWNQPHSFSGQKFPNGTGIISRSMWQVKTTSKEVEESKTYGFTMLKNVKVGIKKKYMPCVHLVIHKEFCMHNNVDIMRTNFLYYPSF